MSYLNSPPLACSHHHTSGSCACVVQEFQKGLEHPIHGKKPMSSGVAYLSHLKRQCQASDIHFCSSLIMWKSHTWTHMHRYVILDVYHLKLRGISDLYSPVDLFNGSIYRFCVLVTLECLKCGRMSTLRHLSLEYRFDVNLM